MFRKDEAIVAAKGPTGVASQIHQEIDIIRKNTGGRFSKRKPGQIMPAIHPAAQFLSYGIQGLTNGITNDLIPLMIITGKQRPNKIRHRVRTKIR